MASARKLGASAVLGEAAAGAFQRSVDKGFGEANESRVIDALRVAEEGGREGGAGLRHGEAAPAAEAGWVELIEERASALVSPTL